jgi:hypothetical protein
VDRLLSELCALLALEDCWFTPDHAVGVPVLPRDGHLEQRVLHYRRGGFELPSPALALGVVVDDMLLGHLICVPRPGVGVSVARRRAGLAVADAYGLALIQGTSEVRTIET